MPRTGRISSVQLVAGVEKQVAAADAQRKAIRFNADQAGPVYLRNDPLGNVPGGAAIGLASPPLECTIEENGDIVNRDWWAYSPVGNVVVGVLDSIH